MMAFAVGGVTQTGLNILSGEIRKILEDFLLGHSRGEIVQDIVDGDSHPADARLPAAFAGFDGDNVSVVRHGVIFGNLGEIIGYSSNGVNTIILSYNA